MANARPTLRPLISRPWTPEEELKLLEMLRHGKHPGVIAARLRRTPAAVRTRRDRLVLERTIGTDLIDNGPSTIRHNTRPSPSAEHVWDRDD
jgi:hypothetical protein